MNSCPDSVISPTSSEDKEEEEEEEENEQQQEEEDFRRNSNITGGYSGGGGTGESSSSSSPRACAACKYQRRRCAPGCLLAPYFPANKHQQFLNAHRLFGLRNLSKVLNNLKWPERDEAIKSMIYEADLRATYPIHGCYGVVVQLKERIGSLENELNLVRRQIQFHRSSRSRSGSGNRKGRFAKTEEDMENSCCCCGSTDSMDDTLNFYYDPDSSSSSSGYNSFMIGQQHQKFDKHNHRTSVAPDLEKSSSERRIVPKVEFESESEKAPSLPLIDLKNAASLFSLSN